MSRYNISYAGLPRWEADDKAIKDAKAYLNAKVWKIIREEADKCKTAEEWRALDVALNFAGVQGYPCHAIGRRYCLTAYRAWMLSGDDPVETDEHGFQLNRSTEPENRL